MAAVMATGAVPVEECLVTTDAELIRLSGRVNRSVPARRWASRSADALTDQVVKRPGLR
ncbi:MAG TPA: hypothetical protein VGI74_17380 [Streptosporangiaceae bacterium]|jgi:hypothetical protein